MAAAGSLAHRFGIDRAVIVAGSIPHSSLGIIYRAGNHTDKREGYVVSDHIIRSRRPFQLFQPIHTFIIDNVRIRTLQAGRFTDPVEINHHFISGTSFGRTIEEVYYLLIVTIHKVHFETFYPHIGILFHHVLHITVESIITCPKDNFHIFRLGIRYDFFQIDLRDHLQQVGFQVDCPTFIQDHILDTMLGSEVDIIFIGIIIDTGTKINIINIPVVPPIPGNLTRLDPGDIANTAGGCQAIHHIAISQLAVVFRHYKYTPGERTGTFRLGNIILTFLYQHLKTVMPALFFPFRIRGMDGFQRWLIGGVVQEHTRIIFQVGFRDT